MWGYAYEMNTIVYSMNNLNGLNYISQDLHLNSTVLMTMEKYTKTP